MFVEDEAPSPMFTFEWLDVNGDVIPHSIGGETTFDGADERADNLAEFIKDGEAVVLRDPQGTILKQWDAWGTHLFVEWSKAGEQYK